jgi:hypothetical protein
LEYTRLAVRNYHEAGNTTNMHVAQAQLAILFDRLGRDGPAATIAGLAPSPLTAALPEFNTAIAHLREVLGERTCESLTREGEMMTIAATATYAYDQIDQARAQLAPQGLKPSSPRARLGACLRPGPASPFTRNALVWSNFHTFRRDQDAGVDPPRPGVTPR